MNTAELSLSIQQGVLRAPSVLANTFSLARLKSSFTPCDLAMDLGTANTVIYARGQGIVLEEPSIIAVSAETEQVVAVGRAAKNLYGKTSSSITCLRPLRDGVVADFKMTALLVKTLVSHVIRKTMFGKPRLVIGVPSSITAVERRALVDAALHAGVREVRLIEEPLATMLGEGLPIFHEPGNAIVNIGGGTTEVAVFSVGQKVFSTGLRIGGDEFDESIQRYVLKNCGLEIGILEAERIKIACGSVLHSNNPRSVAVHGRNVTNGLPAQLVLNSNHIREALTEPAYTVITSVVGALLQCPPELSREIASRGVTLSGGGALLPGMAELLTKATKVPFHLAERPLESVALGAGQVVENFGRFQEYCLA